MDKYYQILGINRQSTIDEIEKIYQSKLTSLRKLPDDDEAYLKVKRERLREAYCAVLLFLETGEAVPDDFKGGADAMEAMLIKARLDKNEIPESAKVKVKNNGKDVALAIGFLIGLFIAAELLVALFPAKTFDAAQQVYLSQYEQAEAEDLYIAEIAEASNAYILAYAEDHPREYTQGGTPKYGARKTAKCEADFIETYWGYGTFGEVADYLCATYEGYTCDSSYDVGCDDSIYAFYGFLPYTDIMGYRNPFNGGVIEYTYQLYLYYVQFYEAYQKGEIPK